MYKNAGYDVRKDFAPIGLIAVSPSLVLANKDVPVRNIPELIAYIKKAGEPFQYGSPGAGTFNHLAAELFARAAKVKLTADPLQGLEPADHRPDRRPHQDRLQSDPGVARRHRGRPHPRARGDLAKRSSLVARCADARGTGCPASTRRCSYGLSAPAGTPRPIVDRLNKALNAAL